MGGTGAGPHLDEHHRTVTVTHDEIDFGSPRTRALRHSIIALHQAQSPRLQMSERPLLGLAADRRALC